MTPAQAMDVGGRLIHLLSQQQLLYRQLRELAQKQTTLVATGDAEMLLGVLAGRQRLINRLNTISEQLEPLRADWQNIAASLPKSQRQQAQGLIEDVQAILGEILACDQRDTETLSEQKEKISQDIRKASLGKRMNRAYSSYGQNGATDQSCFLETNSG